MAMTFATIALPGYTHRNKHLEEGFRSIDRFLDPRLSHKSLLLKGGVCTGGYTQPVRNVRVLPGICKIELYEYSILKSR